MMLKRVCGLGVFAIGALVLVGVGDRFLEVRLGIFMLCLVLGLGLCFCGIALFSLSGLPKESPSEQEEVST